MSGFELDVFVSYASVDRDRDPPIERIVHVLKDALSARLQREARVFYDESGIAPGDRWPDSLRDAAERSKVMVACLSPAYFESTWCQREWSAFAARQRADGARRIYPLGLHRLDPNVAPAASKRGWMDEAQQLQTTDAKSLLDGSSLDRFANVLHASIDADAVHRSAPSRAPGSVAMRWGSDRAAFVRALAEASKVTIVGITLQRLTDVLDEALTVRQTRGRPPWQQLRVVALNEKCLSWLHDESQPSSRRADRDRRLAARQAQTSLTRWLENCSGAHHWSLHTYSFMLPFVGALFEFDAGQRVAQVAHLAPGRSASERLYLEFDSFLVAPELAHYEACFDSIVRAGDVVDEMIVSVMPNDHRYDVKEVLRRGDTFRGRPRGGLLAAMVALLWDRDDRGRARPLLQVRTSGNSRRELQTLSNLTGYVNAADLGAARPKDGRTLPLQDTAWVSAVHRELREELGLAEARWQDPEPAGTVHYYHADPTMENFVFRVYTVQMTLNLEDLQHRVAPKVELGSWSVEQMCSIRGRQALVAARNALSQPLSTVSLQAALKIVALNLRLHDEVELAARLDEAPKGEAWRGAFLNAIDARIQAWHPVLHRSGKHDIAIQGFAGLQYRAFFSTVLPAYARIGVDGAARLLAAPGRADAAAELAHLYADLRFVRTLPASLE